MPRHRSLREALAAPAPKGVALAAAIPLLVLALVGTTAALAMGGPRSQAVLEEHIRRKQRYLWLKRSGQIHPKIKFKTWERHEYPRPTRRTVRT